MLKYALKRRGRPKKTRTVSQYPKIEQFSPRGKPGRPDEAILALDEYEALRLADYLGLKQKDSAESMKISQQTFSRILKKARQTLAVGLVDGKIIRIHGGHYVIKSQKQDEETKCVNQREIT